MSSSSPSQHAGLADQRKAHSEAVEAKLRQSDAHLDELEGTVDALSDSSRERAQEEVRDLKREKAALARRAGEAREASDERWGELKEDVAAALEKLNQRADEVAKKLRPKRPG
jgi:DNA anti-recombination protein RmuC